MSDKPNYIKSTFVFTVACYLIFLLCLSACSSNHVYYSGSTSINTDRLTIPNPFEASYLCSINNNQDLVLALVSKAGNFSVVGLTLTGQKIFELEKSSLNPLKISSQFKFASNIPLNYLFTDLILIFSNTQDLQQLLNASDLELKQFELPDRQRVLVGNNKVLTSISYKKPKNASILFQNYLRNYSIQLTRIG